MSATPVSDTDLLEVVAAVQKYKSKAAAARAMGIARQTLHSRYEQARHRKLFIEEDPTGKMQNEADILRQRIREYERENADLETKLENFRASKFKMPTSKATKVKGAFSRVIIPDTHGCHVEEKAIAAFLSDLEILNPAEIVMLGDHLECGGWLAQSHTLGYVAQTTYTFEDDINAANQLLDRLQEICPKATFHYIEGNHEQRIERWCVTQALRNSSDAALLLKHHSPISVLGLEKRNIPYYRRSEFYQDLPIPGTIKLGRCHFTHGLSTAKHAASVHLIKFGGNVVYGHTHRADSFVDRTVTEGVIGAWSPGCLCKLQPYWMHTNLTGWSHGYGLQLVAGDGSFLHINVPIIDGRSYLVQLTERIG
jgi:UDP-2,3-diacylglucosamine pyrophosphatase LpxH